jgi:hypothetical protein
VQAAATLPQLEEFNPTPSLALWRLESLFKFSEECRKVGELMDVGYLLAKRPIPGT